MRYWTLQTRHKDFDPEYRKGLDGRLRLLGEDAEPHLQPCTHMLTYCEDRDTAREASMNEGEAGSNVAVIDATGQTNAV